MNNSYINWNDFEKIEIRVGKVIDAQPFEKARKAAYQLKIDFGDEIGIKKSSAQITDLYQAEELVGKRVQCVINFPPKQIANFISEVLVTGYANDQGYIVLPTISDSVPLGSKLF